MSRSRPRRPLVRTGPAGTVGRVQTLPAALVSSPFISSFIGTARPVALDETDPARRAAAWAQWAVKHLAVHTSTARDTTRSYPAIDLPGRFYSPGSDAPTLTPHLEIPLRTLEANDPTFPARLAAAGMGLTFPQWLKPEVTALKRAVFAPTADPTALLRALWSQRPALVAAVAEATGRLRGSWDVVAASLLADPAELSEVLARPATASEIAGFCPALAAWRLTLALEPGLLERSGTKVARRVGVWLLVADTDDGSVRLPAVTPRLTASSMLNDELFDPYGEGVAALVARGVVLRRLLAFVGAAPVTATVLAPPVDASVWLRAHPPQRDGEMPRASVRSAVAFLQAFPSAVGAWNALEGWATKTGAALTVGRAEHAAAHTAAMRALQRAEDPDSRDIDQLLPLAWVAGKVARVTVASRER